MASSLFPSRHICFAGGTKGKLPQAIPGIVAGIHAIDEFLIKEHIVIARAVLSDKLRPAADLGLDGSLGTQQEPLLRVSGQLRYHQQIRDDIHRFALVVHQTHHLSTSCPVAFRNKLVGPFVALGLGLMSRKGGSMVSADEGITIKALRLVDADAVILQIVPGNRHSRFKVLIADSVAVGGQVFDFPVTNPLPH